MTRRLATLLAAAVLLACSKEEPVASAAAAVPAVRPPARTAEDRTILFLLDAADEWNAAGDICYAAEQCGDVEASPHRGAVAHERDMAPCFERRIPECAAAVQALLALGSPPLMAQQWSACARRRAALKLDLARLLQDVLSIQEKLPKVREPSRPYGTLLTWANKNNAAFHAAFEKLDAEENELLEQQRELDIWLTANRACWDGESCNIDKVTSRGGGSLHPRLRARGSP